MYYDRLSDLPDDLKLIIMTNLRLADAARLGSTNRAWRATWLTKPNLQFCPYEFMGSRIRLTKQDWNLFNDTVKGVLTRHVGRISVLKLDLYICDLRSLIPSFLCQWIDIARKKGVTKVDINYHPFYTNIIRSCLNLSRNFLRKFRSDINELTLCSCHVQTGPRDFVKSPFHNLTVVRLFRVHGNYLGHWLNACSNLQILEFHNPVRVSTLSLRSQSLQRLIISDLDTWTTVAFEHVPNLRQFDVGDAADLCQLRCGDYLFSEEPSVHVLASVRNALSSVQKLSIEVSQASEVVHCMHFLECLPNLQHLELQADWFMGYDDADLTRFHDLSSLHHVSFFGDFEVCQRQLHISILQHLLIRAPNLERLYVKGVTAYHAELPSIAAQIRELPTRSSNLQIEFL